MALAHARAAHTGEAMTKTVTVRFVFRTPRHQYVLMLLGLGMVAFMGYHAVVLWLRAGGASAAGGGGGGGGANGGARGAKSD
jgi:hypothetical protein